MDTGNTWGSITSAIDNASYRANTQGTVDGIQYEFLVRVLFMIQAYIQGVKYILVSNKYQFGDFDDLVALCEFLDGLKKLICVQVKLKVDPSKWRLDKKTLQDGTYNIANYFLSVKGTCIPVRTKSTSSVVVSNTSANVVASTSVSSDVSACVPSNLSQSNVEDKRASTSSKDDASALKKEKKKEEETIIDTERVILTNVTTGSDVDWKNVSNSKDLKSFDLLNTGNAFAINSKNNDSLLKSIKFKEKNKETVIEVDAEERETFLNNTVFLTDQRNVNDLTIKIIELLKEDTKIIDKSDLEIVFKKLTEEIKHVEQELMENSIQIKKLTEEIKHAENKLLKNRDEEKQLRDEIEHNKNKLLEISKKAKHISHEDFATFLQVATEYLEYTKLEKPEKVFSKFHKVQSTIIQSLNVEIKSKSSSVVLVRTEDSSTLLTYLKVYQALQVDVERPSTSDISVNIEDLGKVLELFEHMNSHDASLIVNCDKKISLYENEVERVLKILRNNNEKKVIFIAKSGNSTSIIEEYPVVNVNYSHTDFDENTKNALLQQDVIFQGEEIELKKLLDSCNITFDSLDYDTIVKLLTGQKISIGNKPECLDESVESCYIPRSLQSCIIKPLAFSELTDKDIFFVSASELKQLKLENYKIYPDIDIQNKNIILFKCEDNMSDIKEAFDSTCNTLQAVETKERKNVHWIHYKNDSFVWRCSSGYIENIKNYVVTKSVEKCEISEPEFLDESKNRKVSLIVDKPGTGKTTLLKILAKLLKLIHLRSWVCYFDLNSDKFTEKLSTMESKMNLRSTEALEILKTEFLEIKNNLELELISKTDLYICFDGFDELSDEYAETLIPFVKSLLQNDNVKIYMTSRENMIDKLQTSFCTLASKIIPLNANNQIDFLTKYYTNLRENAGPADIKKFATKLHEALTKVNRNIQSIMGIPLLIKMLALINETNFMNYLRTGKLDLNAAFANITDLYDEFFELHIERYIENKEGMSKTHSKFKRKLEKIKQDIREIHQILAVKSLAKQYNLELTAEEIEKIIEYKSKKTEIEQYGIVSKIDEDVIKFLHLTFAEYLVATYIVEHLQVEGSSGNVATLATQKLRFILLGLQSQMIRKFMDPMLDNFDATKLRPDILRYTAKDLSFHQAIREDNFSICKFVLNSLLSDHSEASTSPNRQKYMQICKNDFLNETVHLGYTHLMLAVQFGRIAVVTMLLDHGAEVNAKGDKKRSALMYAARYGHSDIVTLLLDRSANINDRDNDGWSALMYAAQRGHSDVVSLLLDRYADIHARTYRRSTALTLAAKWRQTEVVSLLLERGANVNDTDEDDDIDTILRRAAARYGYKCIPLLVRYGADVNAVNKDGSIHLQDKGRTALHIAVNNDDSKLCKILIKHGADVTIKNNKGLTPLELAIKLKHALCVEILQSNVSVSN